MSAFIEVQKAEMVFTTRKGRFHALRQIDLKVEHIIIAIFTIGIVGLLLEQGLMLLARRFSYGS